jgi:streptogramin lyase
MRRRVAVAAAIAALTLVPSAQTETTVGQVTLYPLPAGSGPIAVANGPGGLWVALRASNQIGLMTTAGGLTTFNVPTANAGLSEITAGPDGNVWFTEQSAGRIGRVTPAGAITEFALPAAASQPHAISAGPDGNVWFTEAAGAQQIGRITPAGAIAEFPVPGGEANDIVTGPDGDLWYTAPNTNNIGRMDPAGGAATEFFTPGTPTSLAVADPSSLWFTRGTGNTVGRIDTTTGTSTAVATTTASNSIVAGHDGNGWFTLGNESIASITLAGTIRVFPLNVTQLGEIAPGPNGAIWVPEPADDRIARISTSTSTAAIPPPAAGKTFGGSTVSGTVRVKLPGSRTFVTLGQGQALPVGTLVDARKGTVQLTATSGGVAYAANFFEGQFKLAQQKKNGSPADLKLFGGSFRGCPRAPRASKQKSIRHLWGDGGGKFRTVGRFSSAAVRGTKWLTDDQCTGTLTKVVAGSVVVRDFARKKNVVVTAGHRYFAAG